MGDEYLSLEGIVVPPSTLEIDRSQSLFEAVAERELPFVSFVECRRSNNGTNGVVETIVFDVDVERPQRMVNEVRGTERIAVSFNNEGSDFPEVQLLRGTFPQVSHLNIRPTELPRSICLYDQPWSEISFRWTAVSFLERIRFWLAETAKGTLHQGDQPLEPMLAGSGLRIILPGDFFDREFDGGFEELRVFFATNEEYCSTLIAEPGTGELGLPFLALSFIANPQMHGLIRHAPQNLRELNEFLKPAGIDLLDRLYNILGRWETKELRQKKLLILVAFPMKRGDQTTIETTDLWAFLTLKSVSEIGIAIDLWGQDGGIGHGIPVVRSPNADGSTIPLDIVRPQFDLTRFSAASLNGYEADERRCVAVGAGALGSQVLRLLAQTGFGKWCVIDEDVILPHNVVRHTMNSGAVGAPKAVAVSSDLQGFYSEPEPPVWIKADVLNPGDKQEAMTKEFDSAEVILDMAASVPVSRFLARDLSSSGHRVSAFLNSTGTDLVVLSEATDRSVPLDCLEVQYYRAILQDDNLRKHMVAPKSRHRYARSCRDISTQIPNHLIALHSGIASRAIRNAVHSDAATIDVWVADQESLDVRHVNVPVAKVSQNDFGRWKLVVDDYVLERISAFRKGKLPNETGGVLVGAFDLLRKIVYVVDTIPSPPDSKEWPTLYIRGKYGLAPQVDQVSELTGGQLEYVGEWHSHPDRCTCLPSNDDLKVFAWLTKHMDDAGHPALMGITGQGDVVAWYLGEMHTSGGWESQL